ncbi:undecaprenyl/decaprenyl-phosphate alpha-N-acetylglucosaminyl 1-phosphate transferase [Patescibacteria group bacterium]|nr:MAG: undecaprenyl/decaprenyl-phosphate alpha-N-acetylglucosaminyl 1-phosphate transferase [Patescibacteria group bacterium]
MWHALYLQPFVVAFVSAVLFGSVALWCAGLIKKQSARLGERHLHSGRVIRLGGLAIAGAFLLTILLDSHLFISHSLVGVLWGVVAILGFGLWDDWRELNWQTQLTFQLGLAGLLVWWGIRVEYVANPWGGLWLLQSGLSFWIGAVVAVCWIVILINVMNWIDGVDGLSGSVTLITSATIFFLALKTEVNQPPLAILAAGFAGAVLGFLVFNFSPARLLAGTAGSMLMGFVLAALSIFAGAKVATALLVLTIPVVDFLWVIGERWRAGKSIFVSDSRHLHHKLLARGWSHQKITLTYLFITTTLALVALNTRAAGKISVGITVAVVTISLLIWFSGEAKAKANS